MIKNKNKIKDTNKIIKYLDDYLMKNHIQFISAPEANKILEEAGLLKDSNNNTGKPLRELLRKGYFPHAYQENGKNSRWKIPHSKNDTVNLHCQEKKDMAGKKQSKNDINELQNRIENSRLNYKPDKTKYLLIAQAPPDNIERFFYYTNVPKHDYLFLGIIGVLYPNLKKEFLESGRNADIKESILLKFKEEGFYLIDLSEFPISYITTSLKDQLPKLADNIKKLADANTRIILIKSDVYEIAFRYLKDRFKNVIDVKIPFPCCGHQNDFKLAFSKSLKLAGYKIEDSKTNKL
ncbi:MAG: hypothetical protein GX867_10630 [Tissierellia bacterium]|jgi:hypothetical protein|nr:hypothetical protein [Tissierellia bacterium]